METSELLVELYGRIPPLAQEAMSGLSLDQLLNSPQPGANSIGWLIWHLARVQDHHISQLIGDGQLWAGATWAEHCGLSADPENTGYGHSAGEMLAVRPDSPAVLVEYLEAVAKRSKEFLESLRPSDLDRTVDTRWDPPVTMGVRLVSVADDCLQHVGQAAYIRGMLIA